MLKWNEANAPMRRNVTKEQVGQSAVYLLSDMSAGVSGEIHYVDVGYNTIGMAAFDDLKAAQSEMADVAIVSVICFACTLGRKPWGRFRLRG